MAKTKSKSIYALSIVLVLAITMMVLGNVFLVSAYNLLCLKKGEIIKFSECNPLMSNYYCKSDIYCSYCVFVGSKGKYCPAPINQCNALGLSCTSMGDNNGTTIDKVPPKISSCSPINNSISSSSKQLVKCSADKASTWYYLENTKTKWKELCSNTLSCMKSVSFDEGQTNLKIRAVDKYGNEAQVQTTFYIDSEDPKIYRTYPKSSDDFANGEFSAQIKEANPKSLILYYGTKSKEADLSKCQAGSSGKSTCDVSVDLSEFDGQTISYWFELTDIANTKVSSKKVSLKVDNTAPKILNPDSFWTQGAGRESKYIYLNILIDEKNFDVVEYKDSKSSSSSWHTACSSLRSGKCVKKLTLSKKGHHIVNLQIVDEAGNSVGTSFEFDVV